MNEPIKKTFSIGENQYTTQLIPADEAWPLACEILALGAEPLARVLGTWIAAEDSLQESGASVEGLQEALAQVDWTSIGGDVAEALRFLAKNKPLMKRLLVTTWRNNKHLDHPDVFNEAFTGNYKELFLCLKEVVRLNGFLLFFE